MGHMIYAPSGHMVHATSGNIVYQGVIPPACPWPGGGLGADYSVAFTGTLIDGFGDTPFTSPETVSQVPFAGENCNWEYTVDTGPLIYRIRIIITPTYWAFGITSNQGQFGTTWLRARKFIGESPAGSYTVTSRFTYGATNTIDDIVVTPA